MHKDANVNWVTRDAFGNVSDIRAQLAVLMDIRVELKRLNNLLHCQNFIRVPTTLAAIKKNTTKRKYKKAAAK